MTTFLTVLNMLNSCLVFFFGLLLSVHIAGGWKEKHQKAMVFTLSLILLIIQGIFWIIWDETVVEKIYPLIAHLPIIFILVFVLKKRISLSVVGVLTAYLCCQLPHWVKLALTELSGSPLAGAISYTVLIIAIYILLRKFFVCNAYAAVAYSRRTLLLFGSLPLFYYLFDYTTTVYTNVLYRGSHTLYEFFPTVLAVFYVLFLTAYHVQTQKRTQAELNSSILNAELKQSTTELDVLRRAEFQTAVYQHDMRHHLNMIDTLICTGKSEQALEYISSIRNDIDAVTPKAFCENDIISLLCSSFMSRANQLGVTLNIDAYAPSEMMITDGELCALISNALENALNAASNESLENHWTDFYCDIKKNKFLIEVKNPYYGEIQMVDDVPVTNHDGHGYGCRSIRSIVEKNRGLCTFDAENGVFVLRIAIPHFSNNQNQ